MKRAKYINITLLLLIFSGFGTLSAYEPPDLNIHLEIRQTKEAAKPYFMGNNCIFTYKADHPVRYVPVDAATLADLESASPDTSYLDEETSEIEERLRDLGYIA